MDKWRYAISTGLENLLEMDGWKIQQEGGYWVKIKIHKVEPSKQIPHGIQYNLTLHDNHNQRVLGFDNAHAPKGGKRRKFKRRIVEYDHIHEDIGCEGIAYGFTTPDQLIIDFWQAVDDVLGKQGIID